MQIGKKYMFSVALQILTTVSGTVTAANTNINTNTTYNAINNITTKDQTQNRINYLENEITDLQLWIPRFKIN